MISLAYPTLACWALLEVGLRVREAVQGKGGRSRDRATRVLIAISLGTAIAAASGATSVAPSLRTPAAVRVFGVIVMWLGLATRVWGVAALGGAFRTTVEVDPDQAVVTSGPYKWIRHPAYAGLLLIVAGLGLALGNWLAARRGSRAQPRARRCLPCLPSKDRSPHPRTLVRSATERVGALVPDGVDLAFDTAGQGVSGGRGERPRLGPGRRG